MKNQNKHTFIGKKKHEDGCTVTVKLASDKDIVATAEYSDSFSESDHPHENINQCLTDINRCFADTENQSYKVSVISLKYQFTQISTLVIFN